MQAPKGGMTSVVNGQYYEGGEFMPTTGLFCGKKGAARLAKVQKWEPKGRFYNLGGSSLFEVLVYEGNGAWRPMAIVQADTHNQAEKHVKATLNITECVNAKQI
jgi:hypothetical protein